MKTQAKEFTAALGRVMPLQRTRTTLPILTCLKIEAAGGVAMITCTDLDAFATACCTCEGDLAPACVDATMLNYLARKAPTELNLEIDGKRLIVKGEGTACLGLQDDTQFPPWPNEKSTPMGIPTCDLAECIHAVEWAPDLAPKISIDLWKECVWVKSTDRSIECCGCDSKEFAYVNRPCISVPAQFMFPAKQAKFLVNALLTTDCTVHLSENWISTQANTFRVAVRLAEGKYIPIDFLLKQQTTPIGKLPMAAILDTLQTVKALGKDEPYTEVKFDFAPEELTILYKSKSALFERVIPHKFEVKDISVRFDTEKALHVFGHVSPTANASLGRSSLFFIEGDYTFALAILQ